MVSQSRPLFEFILFCFRFLSYSIPVVLNRLIVSNVDGGVLLIDIGWFCLPRKPLNNCDALRDLVSFVQFKKREKHTRRSVTFSNVVYRIAQSITFLWSLKLDTSFLFASIQSITRTVLRIFIINNHAFHEMVGSLSLLAKPS